MGKKIGVEAMKFILYLFGGLIISYFGITRTNISEKLFNIDKKADKTFVIQQDDLIRNDLNAFKVEVDKDMDRIIDNMNERFDEQNQTLNLVVELLKE